MADLGNLYFDILLRDMTDQDIDKIKKKLERVGVKIGADVNRQTLVSNIKAALKNKTFTIDVTANTNVKKAVVEADKSAIINSVRDALRGQTFSANLRLTVSSATVDQAIKDAFAKAGMKYSPFPQRAVTSQRALGDAYRYASKGAYQSARASVVLGRSFHANIRLAGELGTALGNFASVFGIKDVLQDIVRIGGQLENQRIALGAILQDGGKATEMFSKIQSLAVKSPFGIMDLNQYTKQLSAYSIPYNELYDTMKRLADISAGVGVDMGRIVLAFGQVRAAGFLKGTELRQFTEANIPMVDKLAERFSNLEKRIVSAGEVYDMISKKKVTFEDVKSVLWDLTGEGGMFNNMQEVLSESLASKWKNLADAVDVMYGKLADGFIGSGLKGLAEGLTELTKNWEYLASAIGSAAASFIIFKGHAALGGRMFSDTKSLYDSTLAIKRQQANALLLTNTYRELTVAERQLVNTTDRLTAADIKRLVRTKQLNKEEALRLIALKKLDAATEAYVARLFGLDARMVATAKNATWFSRAITTAGNALKGFGSALKSLVASPWTWVTLGITAIVELFTYYSKKQDEIEERNKNFAESAKGSAETLERELLKIKDLDIPKMNTDEMKIKVKELTTVIQNEADGWQSILSEIFAKEADGTFKNSVEEQLKLLKAKMDELAEAKKKLMSDDETYSDVIGSTESGFLWWKEDVLDKIKDYNKAVEKNDNTLKRLGVHARDVSEALQYAIAGDEFLTEELAGKSLNQQVALLSEYSDEWQKFIEKLSDTNPQARSIASIWKANIPSRRDVEEAFAKAKAEMDNIFALRGEDINNFTEYGKQTILGFVDGMISETATQRPKMRQWTYDWWTGKYNLPRNDLDYVVPFDITKISEDDNKGGSKKDAIAELWKKRVAEIEKAVKIYDKWKSIEGKLFAENRVKGSDEFANLFNGKYGFNLDLESPTEAYEYVQSILDETKEKQKELIVNLGVKISDAEYNDAKRVFDKYLNEIKEYVKESTSKWDLYKQLFQATGDKEFAKSAFKNTQVWDDAARELQMKLKDEMEKQGVLSEIDFTISDAQAKEVFEGKSGLFEIWKEIKDRIEKKGIDVKVNAAKAIESVQSIQDKIKSKGNQRDEELKLYTKDTPEYDAIAKKWENEIVALKGELFELTPAFKDLFVDTTGMASGKLHELWQQAKDLVDLIRNNTTRLVYDENGQIKGRYYKDKDGNEQYIAEDSFEKLDDQTNKLSKKVPEVKVAFDNLWNAIRGKGEEGYGLKDIAHDISVLAQEAASTADALSSMFDSLGNESAADIADFTGNMLNSVASIGQGIASGNPLAVISGIANGISSIAQFHDKKLDRAIRNSQLEVKKLQNAYNQLESVIERQFGSSTDTQNKVMLDNLKRQRAELQKQYNLEDEKKKTDKGKLEDYKQQMSEISDQIKYFYEDLASEQYNASIKDWSKQIAESLTQAFASGEDAAQAFDNTVAEILRNLATEAIRLQFIEPAMADLRNYMFGDNGIFTDNSANGADLSSNELVGLSAELEKLKGQIESSNEYWDKINEATGGILNETSDSASGGLSNGVQSVTEDTANLLGSYLNSIRQSVHVKQQLLEKLVSDDIPQMSYIAQAQLRELNQIAANTKRNADAADKIYDLVNRVVDKGSNKIKV